MDIVTNKEKIVRILHNDWVVDGKIQVNAFSMRQNETYVSVNRPAIQSFTDDVSDFVCKHLDYLFTDTPITCRQAAMITGEVRNIVIELGGRTANVSIEVEPRGNNYLSHAGIFTRYGDKNIKGSSQTDFPIGEGKHMPASAILQKVQLRLLQLSTLETLEIVQRS